MAKAVVMMLMAVAVVVVAALSGAKADDCNPAQLAVCLPALSGGSAPTDACCSNLRAQQGCLCNYENNPAYKQYLKNAVQVLKACGIAVPNC